MVMSGSLRVFQPLAGADIQGRWPPRLVMGKGGGGNETLQQQHEREQDRPHPPRRGAHPDQPHGRGLSRWGRRTP